MHQRKEKNSRTGNQGQTKTIFRYKGIKGGENMATISKNPGTLSEEQT